MTKEFKAFINALVIDPIVKAFLLINKMIFTIANIQIDKRTGSVSFDAITNYSLVEKVTLTRTERKVWDLFCEFNNAKNATAVILEAIESGGNINSDSYKNQSKITPKKIMPKVKTFSQFWETLNPDEKVKAEKLAETWIKANHIGADSFDFFFINGTNGLTLKNGDFLHIYDSMYGETMATEVFQASPAGFVTCLDNGGHFTLAKDSKPVVVSREMIPAEILEILKTTSEKLTEDTEAEKIKQLTKAIGAEAKAEEEAKKEADKLAKAEAKAEATKKAEAEKIATFATLQKMKLTTPAQIEEAVAKLNASKLAKEQTEAIRAQIKEAKATIKKAEAEAKAKEAEATKAKEAKAKATEAKATPAPAKATPAKATAKAIKATPAEAKQPIKPAKAEATKQPAKAKK